jgi:phosphoglycolate phosphatase
VIRAIFFDVDGTLIRTGGAGVQAFDQTFTTEFNVQNGTVDLTFAGKTDLSIVREFFRRHHLDPSPEQFQRFFDLYVFWLDHLLHTTQGGICPGVWNFIHNSQAIPHPPLLGLLTGNIRLGAEIKLRHYYLWDSFEIGAFGDDHEDRNQLAVIALQRAQSVLGSDLEAKDVLVVGDTPLDVQCAKTIGAQSLAVATGPYALDQLKATNPTQAVTSLGEVSASQICA